MDDEAPEELESVLKPDPPMTRSEFYDKCKRLLDELQNDHEACTGVTDEETHPWDYWMEQLGNAYLNS